MSGTGFVALESAAAWRTLAGTSTPRNSERWERWHAVKRALDFLRAAHRAPSPLEALTAAERKLAGVGWLRFMCSHRDCTRTRLERLTCEAHDSGMVRINRFESGAGRGGRCSACGDFDPTWAVPGGALCTECLPAPRPLGLRRPGDAVSR